MKNTDDFTSNIDEQLSKALRDGNEKAFLLIFNTYHKVLYALAYRYLKSRAEAEDAIQHTFMRLWEQREVFHFTTSLRSLLFTILKNYILNELRHRRIVFEKHYELMQKDEEIAEDIIKALEDTELRNHLRAAINELPVQKRKICLLKIEEGLSNQEIADKLQITIPTVKSHYTQAIKQLRQVIDKLILILLFC
ncbi:RNA polymerase sigma-70 factor [Bacteroides sp. 51]|uniref:RNA polymerase sigma-70 factor n=1 Tax=Bacteroides sp. 51 TaxID=2302938 RepID=UPI0013CFDE5E|nr:RNA polymerase sigma-70 factor [Bacteroides sp. 51]NDV84021.1 RNA polymerase sigma-70 factor [Bacteroides sp. 51]